MQQRYLVGTGIVLFPIDAESPRQAIACLKQMIDARRHERRNAKIGMSLVKALDEGTLNFGVFDATRTHLLAGELFGEYQEPATRALADQLSALVPEAIYFSLPV